MDISPSLRKLHGLTCPVGSASGDEVREMSRYGEGKDKRDGENVALLGAAAGQCYTYAYETRPERDSPSECQLRNAPVSSGRVTGRVFVAEHHPMVVRSDTKMVCSTTSLEVVCSRVSGDDRDENRAMPITEFHSAVRIQRSPGTSVPWDVGDHIVDDADLAGWHVRHRRGIRSGARAGLVMRRRSLDASIDYIPALEWQRWRGV